MLITIPISSMQFFSFFDVHPIAPTITGMTLIVQMFQILLISFFSSWYLSIFSFSFLLILISPDIAISIVAQLLSFLFTTTIPSFLAFIFLSYCIITFHKIFWSMFIPLCSYVHRLIFSCISKTISNELFL